MTSRTIRSGRRQSSIDLQDLLQSIFVAELLSPSRAIWLISPWVSDVPIVDNADLSMRGIDPTWPARGIGLADVLGALARRDTVVRVETRPLAGNRPFIQRLFRAVGGGRPPLIRQSEVLHEKGLLGDDYYLSGSMNFTLSGLQINDEYVHFTTEVEAVSRAQVDISSRWASS